MSTTLELSAPVIDDFVTVSTADLASTALSVTTEFVNTRKVRLQYTTDCGCGPVVFDIIRTVPADSSLKDGDVTNEFLDGDVYA